jgi:predicted PurR-regulated permease PerM
MRSTMTTSPGPVQRAATRVWLAVGIVALAWVAWQVMARPLAVIIPPLLLATVIVYVLSPIVAALERRGLPRWVGALVAYLVALVALFAMLSLLVPLLVAQLQTFSDRLPDLLAGFRADLDRQLGPLGIEVPVGETIDVAAVQANVEQALQGGGLAAVAGVLGGLSGLALSLLQTVIVFTLGPVIGFYVLIDLPRLSVWVQTLIPPQHRAEAVEVGSKLHFVVGGFIRGQLLVALFVGVAASIGLAIVGLPFWLLVGVLAGVTNVIPLLGPFVAGAVGVSIALISDGVGLAALVLVVLVVVQQLDNQIISPLVMGRNVQLHPLVVLLALVIAGTVYGVVGLLIAVPGVAAVSVLARHLWETRVPWATIPPTLAPGAPAPDAPATEGERTGEGAHGVEDAPDAPDGHGTPEAPARIVGAGGSRRAPGRSRVSAEPRSK